MTAGRLKEGTEGGRKGGFELNSLLFPPAPYILLEKDLNSLEVLLQSSQGLSWLRRFHRDSVRGGWVREGREMELESSFESPRPPSPSTRPFAAAS